MRPAVSRSAGSVNGLFFLSVFVLTVAAFIMRLYRLEQAPAGLFYDEAYEGLDAYSLFGKPPWQWPLFFTAINGREPLFVYLVHLAQSIWGPSVLAVRAVSATAGALLTPATIWLGWEIAPSLGIQARRRFALWAGLAVLALLWSQTIARLGQRMSLFVLVESLLWAALWRAWRVAGGGWRGAGGGWRVARGGWPPTSHPLTGHPLTGHPLTDHLWWALAGVWAGLSFYTYLAVRLVPFVLLLLLGLALLCRRSQLRLRWRGMGTGLVVALIVAAPLAIHFLLNPDHFNMRTGQVDILSQGGLPALAGNLGKVLGMATLRGDFNVRLNYPDRPVLDLFTGLPFLVGLALALWRFWRPAPFFLLAALGVMLLPTLLSEEAPNFGRAIGALPSTVLLIVYGLDRLAAWGERLWPGGKRLYSAVGWAVLLAATVLTWRVYFVQWVRLPDLFAAWDSGYTAVARHVLAMPADSPVQRVYVGPGADNPSLHYLLADAPQIRRPQGFDGRSCVRVATDRPARYYVLTTLDLRGEPLLRSYLPDSEAWTAVVDENGRDWARALEQPPGGRVVFPEMVPLSVPLSDGIQLAGYWLSQPELQPGERLYVRLFWQVTAAPARSYTAFVHLVQQGGGMTVQVAGVDALPGNGACLTREWLPGEVVVDELQFVLPDQLPGRGVYLGVGLYTLTDGRRLDVSDSAEDWILIGPLPVGGG